MSKLISYAHYELHFVTAYHYQAQGRFTYRVDRRMREALVYIEKGQARFLLDDFEATATEGDWVYLPKGLRYETFWTGKEISYVTLDFDLGKRLILQHVPHVSVVDLAYDPPSDTLCVLAQGSALMKRELDALMCAFQSNKPTENVLCAAAFYRLWHDALEALSKTPNDRVIARAVARIEARPLEPICLEELCRLCCLSRSGFFQRFRAETGFTPVQYRNRLLARMAQELLETGKYTKSQVADMLGVCSADYLTVLCRKHLPENHDKKKENRLSGK